MANRFQYKEKNHTYMKFTLSLCVFLIILLLFFYGMDSLSKDTTERQMEGLETSLRDTVTYCYAVEGSYPESVKYMEDNYGLTYDEAKFYVGYRTLGANILPDITVIELEE
ncbi:MAG: hypothetical protein GX663_09980 [Clostridiales bacterium]|nr:hypothetical protein [Clostridiales bacterium]